MMTDEQGGTTRGAAQAYEPMLAELLGLYPRLMAAGGSQVKDDFHQVTHLAHGWYMRCHRGVRAMLRLDEAGFAEEAAPIRRSIVEHAVALHWLVTEGDGILDTVARGHAFGATKHRDAVEAARWTSIRLEDFDEAIASTEFDLRGPTNDNLLHVVERIRRYSDAHSMTIWLSEVALCHPSYESAISYVDAPQSVMLPGPRGHVWQVPFATTWLLESLVTLQEIFVEPPWTDLLGRVLSDYQAINNKVRVESGLLPVDWATGKLLGEDAEEGSTGSP